MIKTLPPLRPATSAIAAFLVLSTPAAFAQTAPADPATQTPASPTIQPMSPPVMVPPVAAPPTVAAPTTAPAAAQQSAQTSAPAPVIRVPVDIEPQAAAPAPRAAERPEPARAERSSAPAPRQAAAEPAPATPAAAPASNQPASSQMVAADDAAPVTAPAVAAAVPPVAAAPAPQPTERVDATGGEFPWELAGGAAVLLLAGGAAVAFARRRRTDGVSEDRAPATVVADPVTPMPAVARAETPRVDPSMTAPAPMPQPAAMRSTPSFAAAPHGSMGRHEAMALVGPTGDNPFLTLKKRLKRARFYDRRDRMAYDGALSTQRQVERKPASAWEISQRPAPAQKQDVRRPERTGGFPNGLRPGYAGN